MTRYFDLNSLSMDDEYTDPFKEAESEPESDPEQGTEKRGPEPAKRTGCIPSRKPSNEDYVSIRNLDRILADPIQKEFSELAGYSVSYKDVMTALMMIHLHKHPGMADSRLQPILEKYSSLGIPKQTVDLSAVFEQFEILQKDNAILRRLLLCFMEQAQATPAINYTKLDQMEQEFEKEKAAYLKKVSQQAARQSWEAATRKTKRKADSD